MPAARRHLTDRVGGAGVFLAQTDSSVDMINVLVFLSTRS